MRRFEGQVVFITGAAHGQGRATALAFAREGARVAGLDIAKPMAYPGYTLGSRSELEQLAADVQAAGSEALTFAADVRDDTAVTNAVSAVLSQFGRIDVLFNNAGICAYGLAHELTEDEWDTMMDVAAPKPLSPTPT